MIAGGGGGAAGWGRVRAGALPVRPSVVLVNATGRDPSAAGGAGVAAGSSAGRRDGGGDGRAFAGAGGAPGRRGGLAQPPAPGGGDGGVLAAGAGGAAIAGGARGLVHDGGVVGGGRAGQCRGRAHAGAATAGEAEGARGAKPGGGQGWLSGGQGWLSGGQGWLSGGQGWLSGGRIVGGAGGVGADCSRTAMRSAPLGWYCSVPYRGRPHGNVGFGSRDESTGGGSAGTGNTYTATVARRTRPASPIRRGCAARTRERGIGRCRRGGGPQRSGIS